jgi:TRAP-type mannitol/chloroaromatic compound transport system permease small subunit
MGDTAPPVLRQISAGLLVLGGAMDLFPMGMLPAILLCGIGAAFLLWGRYQLVALLVAAIAIITMMVNALLRETHVVFGGLWIFDILAVAITLAAIVATTASVHWEDDDDGLVFGERVLLAIDRISAAVGKLFAWSIVLLTAATSYEVFARYLFNAPTRWAFDISYMLYGALFMGGGAYALSRNGHVRGDFLYRNFSPKKQASFDLVLYVLFFFPGMIAFLYSGWGYYWLSFIMNEHSSVTPRGPIIWPFKGLIPFVGGLMLLQGAAETARCVMCLKLGAWPHRLRDVEELEKVILAKAAAERGEAPEGAR